MAPFLEMVHRLQAAASEATQITTADDQLHVEIGRTHALAFIDAVRAGDKTPNLLMFAVALVGKGNALELAGFLAEIQEFIAEVRP